MLRRHSRAYRLVLLVVVVVGLGALGYFGYRMYSSAQQELNLAVMVENSYERGKTAYEAGDLVAARSALDEAEKLSVKAMETLDKEKSAKANTGVDRSKDFDERRARLLWLRARVMRDLAFTDAALDQKPLSDIEDSITHEMFRSLTKIPDESTKTEAIRSLREAAFVLKRDPAVQQEALRLELMMDRPDWGQVERLAKNVLEVDQKNVRANYFLARIEYLQPQESKSFTPLPEKDRSRERVEKAREHLQVVREAKDFPLWRTLYLDSQIVQWLAKKLPPMSSVNARKAEEQLREDLRKIYFEPNMGALDRAKNQEAFVSLSKVDVDGLIGLHEDAVKLGLERAKTSMGGQTEDLYVALRGLIELAKNLVGTKYGEPYSAQLLEACTGSAMMARRYLGSDTPVEWPAIRDGIEKLARQVANAHKSTPRGYAQMAHLLNSEAFIEGKKNNLAVKNDLETRALSWVDDGLRLAAENKTPTAARTELHAVALQTLAGRSNSAEQIASHLNSLRRINDPKSNAVVDMHEAAAMVRQGKLILAEEMLRTLSTNPEAKEFRAKVAALQAKIYLSLGKPSQALGYLRDLERSYKEMEALDPGERAFVMEFLRDPRDLTGLIVQAELDTAVEKLARYRAENSGRPLDQAAIATIQSHEENARMAIRKLTAGSESYLQANARLIAYYLRQGIFDRASELVKSLEEPFAHSADLLRLRAAVAMLPDGKKRDDETAFNQRRALADNLIKEFITNHPTDSAAKRLWVEWLMRTNRGDEGLAYLENPDNFPGQRDEATRRMLAVLQLSSGNRDEGVRMLQDLAKDDSINLLLIQATANPIQRQQLIEEAIGKTQNNGAVRILEADRLFAEGKFDGAAEKFREAREFTRVSQRAANGLVASLRRLADSDPDKALQLVERFMTDSPNEPLNYSIAALAKLRQDEFGSPADSWENSKTMWGAIRTWEALAGKGGMDTASRMLFRAQFLAMANRPDEAFRSLEQVAAASKPNEELLANMVGFAMKVNEPAYLDAARNYVQLLRNIRPQALGYKLLDAELSIARGDYPRAIALLEPIIDAEPKTAAAYPSLIRALNAAGDTARAAEWTQRFLKVSPENVVAVQEQIRQLLAAGSKDLARQASEVFAIESVNRLQSKLPMTKDVDLQLQNDAKIKNAKAAAHLILAQTWFDGGDLDGSQVFLDRSIKEDPRSIGARLLWAQIAMARKNWKEAADAYSALLADDKENLMAKTNLAWIQAAHLDRPAEALKMIRGLMVGQFSGKPIATERLDPVLLDVIGTVFEKAAQSKVEPNLSVEMKAIFEAAANRYPSNPKIQMHLGESYANLAEKDKATNAFQKSLQLAKEGKGPMNSDERKEFIRKVDGRIKGL